MKSLFEHFCEYVKQEHGHDVIISDKGVSCEEIKETCVSTASASNMTRAVWDNDIINYSTNSVFDSYEVELGDLQPSSLLVYDEDEYIKAA